MLRGTGHAYSRWVRRSAPLLLALGVAACVEIPAFPAEGPADGVGATDGASFDLAPPPELPPLPTELTWPTSCTEAFQAGEPALPTPSFEPIWPDAPEGDHWTVVPAPDGRVVIGRALQDSGTWELAAFDEAGAEDQILVIGVAEGDFQGIVDVAFHPQWPERGEAFVSYVAEGAPRALVVARVERTTSEGLALNPGSLQPLLEVPQPNERHMGGWLDFGADGGLYVALGDGGGLPEPAGGVVRVDVDTEVWEVFARGLRDPRSLDVDTRGVGHIWVTDEGDADSWVYGEVDVVAEGDHLGWPQTSGAEVCEGCDPASFAPAAVSVQWQHQPSWRHPKPIGSVVYRGAALPQLQGATIYYDNVAQSFFAYRHGVEPPPGVALGAPKTAEGAVPEIQAVLLDHAGEVIVHTGWSRGFWRLAGQGGAAAGPATLWPSGCFEADAGGVFAGYAEGMIAYGLAAPQWQDHAYVSHHLGLPEGGRLEPKQSGAWDASVGSVLVQTFSADVVGEGGALERLPIETRVLARRDAGWAASSYRWDDQGRDATRVTSGERRKLQLVQPQTGTSAWLWWEFASPAQCGDCHGRPGTGELEPLGLNTAQLSLGGQIEGLVALGASAPPPAAGAAATLVDIHQVSPSADLLTLENAARSWMGTACAPCHRPAKLAHLELDLSAVVPLVSARICGVPPSRGYLGISEAQLLAPGDPDRSALLERVATEGPHRMPTLSGASVDARALEVLRAWIAARPDCADL